MADIIFEVSVTLPGSARELALDYMIKKHIPEVLRHKAFIKANFFVLAGPATDQFAYTTHYYCRSHELLAEYQAGYATKMRQDFADHLGQFSPQMVRRVLELKHSEVQREASQ
jgi:hypothetical protein